MNIDQYIYDLLYSIPPNVDYTDLPEELDKEDISLDHVNGLLNIINRENDIYLLFRSSFLLNSWGFDEGFQKITSLLYKNKLNNLIVNNKNSSDDTYKHVLSSYISYCAIKSDSRMGEEARKKYTNQ